MTPVIAGSIAFAGMTIKGHIGLFTKPSTLTLKQTLMPILGTTKDGN
jgi:hypothetical protein